MTSLESRYRSLLRAYPRRWRARREVEMLAVLLDLAQARGRTRPGAGEVLHLVASGLAARAEPVLGLVAERTRGRIAALAVLSGAALVVSPLLQAELPSRLDPLPQVQLPWMPTAGWTPSVALLVYLGWLAGAAAVLAGRPGPGRSLIATSTVLTAATPWLDGPLRAGMSSTGPVVQGAPVYGPPPLYFLGVLVFLGVLACSAPVYGTARTRRRAGLGGLLLAAVLFYAPWTNGPDAPPWIRYSGPPFVFYRSWGYGLSAIATAVPWLLGAAVVVALAAGVRRRGWAVPVLTVSVPWAYLSLFGGTSSTARGGVPGALVLTAVLGVLAVAGLTARAAGFVLVREPRG